ncbi:MAG: molybdopterin-binding protein, partial [Methylococcales bacterium]
MHPVLEIFSQGEEIVTGQVVDSNAAWLSQQAVELGFSVTRHTAVGDKLADLIGLLQEIAQRADCCICTGGLGPTSDDLTAQAVSEAFALPLEFDALAYAQIEQFFRNRNKPMPASNRKQALLPQGALRLDNHWGTAPGFALQVQRCWFAFIPGVPTEMQHLYVEKIRPILLQRFKLTPKTLVTIKTVGIGESDLQQRINAVSLPQDVELGFRAGSSEVHTKLLFPADYPQADLNALANAVAAQIGDSVFAIDRPDAPSGDLPAVLNSLMITRQQTLTVIETASQGLLSGLCSGVTWLAESVYQRDLDKLCALLAVDFDDNDLLSTGRAIAAAKRLKINTDLVLVQIYQNNHVQFVDSNQAITIHHVLLSKEGYHQSTHNLVGTCQRKQN